MQHHQGTWRVVAAGEVLALVAAASLAPITATRADSVGRHYEASAMGANAPASARTAPPRERQRRPIAAVAVAGCEGEWYALVGSGIELSAAAVAYNILGAGAAGLLQSATAHYLDSLLNWANCLYAM